MIGSLISVYLLVLKRATWASDIQITLGGALVLQGIDLGRACRGHQALVGRRGIIASGFGDMHCQPFIQDKDVAGRTVKRERDQGCCRVKNT